MSTYPRDRTLTRVAFASRVVRVLEGIEAGVLVSLLGAMIVLAVVQIILRNFFDSGILWGDAFLRVLVLWVTLLGSMVAARRNDHIRMDVLLRYLPERWGDVAVRVAVLFTSSICFVMAYASFRFVQFEYEDGLVAFGSVPTWACEVIIPVAMAVMGARYAILVFVSLDEE